MRKIIKGMLLTICLSIFIFSGYKIYCYWKEESANKKLNEELIKKAVSKPLDNKVNEKDDRNTLPIDVDFSFLKQQNKEIIGWIYCENTPISYPIVQSEDNQKYLRKLIDGSYNTAGTIFMDYRNTSNLTDNNTILYGHNMKNGTMFGTLQKYKKQEYYDEHNIMYLLTEKEKYKIEIFAGYTISVDSDIYDLSKLDKNKIESMIKKSDFKSNTIITETDKIITLSTCAYEYEGARYVVMGRLEKIEEG